MENMESMSAEEFNARFTDSMVHSHSRVSSETPVSSDDESAYTPKTKKPRKRTAYDEFGLEERPIIKAAVEKFCKAYPTADPTVIQFYLATNTHDVDAAIGAYGEAKDADDWDAFSDANDIIRDDYTKKIKSFSVTSKIMGKWWKLCTPADKKQFQVRADAVNASRAEE